MITIDWTVLIVAGVPVALLSGVRFASQLPPPELGGADAAARGT